MTGGGLGWGADIDMGFGGVRFCAPELARILLARSLAGHALRHASGQERTPPKPLFSVRPPSQGLLCAGGRGGGGPRGEECGSDGVGADCGGAGGDGVAMMTVRSMRPPGKGRGERIVVGTLTVWSLPPPGRGWGEGIVETLTVRSLPPPGKGGGGRLRLRRRRGGPAGAGLRGFGRVLLWLWVGLLWGGAFGGEGNSGDTMGEAGAFGHLNEGAAYVAPKDSVGKKPARAKAARKQTPKPAGAEPDSARTVPGNVPVTPPAAVGPGAQGAPGDSARRAADSAGADSPAVGKPVGDSGAAGGGDPLAARGQAVKETLLVMLPMAAGAGVSGSDGELERAEAALRMGLNQAGRFRILTEEEATRFSRGGERLPKACFSERCLEMSARRLPSGLVVASQYSKRDSVTRFKLVMAEAPTGKIHWAVQIWGRAGKGGSIPFAREAAIRFAMPEAESAQASGERAGIEGSFFTTRSWREVPWLNPNDSTDNRRSWGWAGSGILTVGLGLAYAEGQLTQADRNHGTLAKDVLSGAGSQSFLRGFFAAPTLGARYAAMGGAGIAQVNNGFALLMNPAGVAETDQENVVAAKRSLPDGTPSLFMAYAGPLQKHWSQGVGVQFEGDRLANETTLHAALGYDLGGLGKDWLGIKVGIQPKIYLAQVGEGGVGEDRSTGRSFGMGLDLGLQARLNERISAAFAIRDAAAFLRHSNTLTDQSYAEALPTEYRVGTAYRASPSLLLLMDGQKGVWADQADHLRLGGEDVLFDFLAIRCGLHEIFGREAVRKMSVGFGLDTRGLGDKAVKVKVALNYAYEFGLGEDAALGAGQQFSLEAGF